MDVTRLRLAAMVAAISGSMVVSCASKSTPRTTTAGVNAGLDALQANPETPVAITPAEQLQSSLDAMKEAEPPEANAGSIASMVEQQVRKQKELGQLQVKKAMAGESSVEKPGLFSTPPPPKEPANEARKPEPPQGLEAIKPPETQATPAKAEGTPAPAEPASNVKTIVKQETPRPESVKPEAPRNEAPKATPETMLIELAARMASLLRQPANAPRISDAAALASIESLRPGSLASLEQPTSTLGGALSVQDRTTLIEARERLASNPDAAEMQIRRFLEAVAPKPTLSISRAALCTRVNGFGNYQPYVTNVFRAGAPIKAIVYLELSNFSTRAAKEGDRIASDAPLDQQVSVDVSQSISVFQDPSGLLVLRTPAQPITDTSRSKRRDFYLIQTISLPPTLSIGKYNVKVQVKDRISGSETEAVIPIVVTAQ